MTYSSTMALGRQRTFGRNHNVVNLRGSRPSLGPISNSIILVVLACLLGLLYLAQVTKTNAYGYKINSLQEQQAQLETEQADLQVASARLQSMDRVQSSDAAKGLVAVAPSGIVR